MDEIEFDILPNEIDSIEKLNILISFMTNLSKVTGKQMTLTDENNPKLPLIKIDANISIIRILTSDEANSIIKNKESSFKMRVKNFISKIEFQFLNKRFKEKLINNATGIRKPTKKNENLW